MEGSRGFPTHRGSSHTPSSLQGVAPMSENAKAYCPECQEVVEQSEPLDRRGFIRVVGEQTATLLAVGGLAAAVPAVLAGDNTQRPAGAPANPRTPRPAEEMIRELYTGLNGDQRGQVVRP